MGRVPPEERFWAKVERTDTCWLWTAAQSTGGYAIFSLGGRSGVAHRYAYELLVTRIPEGMVTDHLCRIRHCVNPAHLEIVTRGENSRRGIALRAPVTRCKRGHRYDEPNTYIHRDGTRKCRGCNRERVARRRAQLVSPN